MEVGEDGDVELELFSNAIGHTNLEMCKICAPRRTCQGGGGG